MGLDNGIYILHSRGFKIPKRRFYDSIGFEDEDICYFRKWYDFREQVLSQLDCGPLIEEKGCAKLDMKSLKTILKILKSYNKNNWRNNFWSWGEVRNHGLKYNIKNLKWLIRFCKKNEAAEIIFYDSY